MAVKEICRQFSNLLHFPWLMRKDYIDYIDDDDNVDDSDDYDCRL